MNNDDLEIPDGPQQEQRPAVVVIRQKRGVDVVGILAGAKTAKDGMASNISHYLIEHPFVPIMDHDTNSLALVPYCPLTSQTMFEFPAVDLNFVEPATPDLTEEYLTGITAVHVLSVTDSKQARLDKIAFRKALKSLSIAPSTETLQ